MKEIFEIKTCAVPTLAFLFILVSFINCSPSQLSNYRRFRRDAAAATTEQMSSSTAPAVMASSSPMSGMMTPMPSSAAPPHLHEGHKVNCDGDAAELKKSCPSNDICPADMETMEKCCHCLSLCCGEADSPMPSSSEDSVAMMNDSSTEKTGFGSKVKGAMNSAEGWLKNQGQNIKSGWDKAKESIKQTATDMKDKVKKGFESARNKFRNSTSGGGDMENEECKETDGKCSTEMGEVSSSSSSSEESSVTATATTTSTTPTPGQKKSKRDLHSYGVARPLTYHQTQYSQGGNRDSSDSDEYSWSRTTTTHTGNANTNLRRYKRAEEKPTMMNNNSTDSSSMMKNSTQSNSEKSSSKSKREASSPSNSNKQSSDSNDTSTLPTVKTSKSTTVTEGSVTENANGSGGNSNNGNGNNDKSSNNRNRRDTPKMGGGKGNSNSNNKDEQTQNSTTSSSTSASTQSSNTTGSSSGNNAPGKNESEEDDDDDDDGDHYHSSSKSKGKGKGKSSPSEPDNPNVEISVHVLGSKNGPKASARKKGGGGSEESDEESADSEDRPYYSVHSPAERYLKLGDSYSREDCNQDDDDDDDDDDSENSEESMEGQMEHPPIVVYPDGSYGGVLTQSKPYIPHIKPRPFNPQYHPQHNQEDKENNYNDNHPHNNHHNHHHHNDMMPPRNPMNGSFSIGSGGQWDWGNGNGNTQQNYPQSPPHHQHPPNYNNDTFSSMEIEDIAQYAMMRANEGTSMVMSMSPSGIFRPDASNFNRGVGGGGGYYQNRNYNGNGNYYRNPYSYLKQEPETQAIMSEMPDRYRLERSSPSDFTFPPPSLSPRPAAASGNSNSSSSNTTKIEETTEISSSLPQSAGASPASSSKPETNSNATTGPIIVVSDNVPIMFGKEKQCPSLKPGVDCVTLNSQSHKACAFDEDCEGAKKCCFYQCDPYKRLGMCYDPVP